MSRSARGWAREARRVSGPMPAPGPWAAGYFAGLRGLELAPDAAPDFRTGHATGLEVRPTLTQETLGYLERTAAAKGTGA